jgi:hypothetical protein
MFAAAGLVVLVAGASGVDSAGASLDAAVEISVAAEVASELELDPQAASASKAIGRKRDFFGIFFDIVNDTS